MVLYWLISAPVLWGVVMPSTSTDNTQMGADNRHKLSLCLRLPRAAVSGYTWKVRVGEDQVRDSKVTSSQEQ